jgi:hypothetical protein
MIPTIEQIIEDLTAGVITKGQALAWILQYLESAKEGLRDGFAASICAAMVSTIRTDDDYYRAKQCAVNMGFNGLSDWFAADSYKQADALMKARES